MRELASFYDTTLKFVNRPISILSLAKETNSTLLTSKFPFKNSSWLARCAVFAIAIGIFPSLDHRGAAVFRKKVFSTS